MNSSELFNQTYRRDPSDVAFCPYRICPIGAHVDHQYGKITGFAVNQGVTMAYSAKMNGIVELASMQFDKRAQWHVGMVPKSPEGDWADHLRGATFALFKRHRLSIGLCGIIEGSLPIGGLSSSAAVIICFLSALCKVNEIRISQQEIIEIAQEAENEYVGVSCGTLDQSCEVLSKKDHLLYLDTKNGYYELIQTNPKMKPYKFVIFFSGLDRALANSGYNTRVDECRSAAYALKAYAGMEYGNFKHTHLREVPYNVFEQYKKKLPDNWRKRAEHFYGESDRVKRGVEAWRNGDIELYGKLSFESGHSSIYNWETGSGELIALYEIMKNTDGIYGGRFSGAGFKGCCMAIIDPAFEESIVKKVSEEYLKIFPNLKGKYSAHVCQSADGVRL